MSHLFCRNIIHIYKSSKTMIGASSRTCFVISSHYWGSRNKFGMTLRSWIAHTRSANIQLARHYGVFNGNKVSKKEHGNHLFLEEISFPFIGKCRPVFGVLYCLKSGLKRSLNHWITYYKNITLEIIRLEWFFDF